MKKLLLTLVILTFILPETVTAVPKQLVPQSQPQIKTANQPHGPAVKKPVAKKRHKKRRYVAAPKESLKVESIPLVSRIPVEAVDALAKSDLEETIRVLRPEPPSSRLLHIMSSAQNIAKYEKGGKAPRIDRLQFYQNLGISYHNLFLFLQRHQIINETFYKSALKFYKKAERSPAISVKYDIALLKAAIIASHGNTEKARELFNKVDVSIIEDDYNSMEYLATYYAAMGDIDNAVEVLDKAHALNPERMSIWVAIGDDFQTIENDSRYKSLITGWKK